VALHGEIKVNGQILASWEAVRQSPDPVGVNTYRCKVTERHREKTFEVDHAYEEGAVALAIKVLSRYQTNTP
jgi:hypothetical protein